MKWRGNSKLHLVVTGVLSATASSFVTFVVANKILETKFQEELGTQIEKARILYQEMYSTPTFIAEHPVSEEKDLLEQVRETTEVKDPVPPEMVDKIGEALDAARRYGSEDPESPESGDDPRPPVTINIFEEYRQLPSDDVVEALLKDRDPSKPYIILKEEFYQNEPDHDQIEFTFWTGDGVLVRDDDEFNPIDDVEKVAGEDNLLHFGYGSNDPNVVYVRNETVDPPMDLHITKSDGKYSTEVLAMDEKHRPDLKHLQHSVPRRFRLHDE